MRTRGFTIIDLLVTIGIMTIATGLMLPALDAAREAVRAASCAANLKQIAMAASAYSHDHQGYLPGPNTSGAHFYQRTGRTMHQPTGPLAPVQPDDWFTPLFGQLYPLPAKREDRLVAILNHDFHCASNAFTYDYRWAGVPDDYPQADAIRQNSYSMPYPLHVYATIQQGMAANRGDADYWPQLLAGTDRTYVDLRPAEHGLRLASMGKLELKIAAMDGARYIVEPGRTSLYGSEIRDNGGISFNPESEGTPWGAILMSRGPALNILYRRTGNPYRLIDIAHGSEPLPVVRKHTFRHFDRVNASFYDGHVGRFTSEQLRRPEFNFPSGAVIKNVTHLVGGATDKYSNGDAIR